MQCPNCGGEIPSNSKKCEFCGSQITVNMQRQQEQLNKPSCPNCGSSNVTFNREKQGEVRGKKGTAVVRSTVGMCKDCGHTWRVGGSQPVKQRKTWLWVLGWIFIFPVPLTILMLRKKDMKPALKYGIVAAAWIVYLLIAFAGGGSDSTDSTSSTTSAEVSSETTEPVVEPITVEPVESAETAETSDKLTFVITPEEKGEYGFENTLNAGTEFEETQVVYHIPAGSYSVKNLGEFPGQFEACSDETHVTDEGWEEPATLGDVVTIEAGGTADFTIKDGYYLEVHLNGQLEFTQK